MPDVSQVRTLTVQAEMDASKYEAGARKKIAADQAMVTSDAQIAASSQKTTSVIATSERAFLRLESQAGGTAKAYAELARAQAIQAKVQETANAGVAAGTISQERASRAISEAAKRVDERRAALQAASEVERIASSRADAHAIALGRMGGTAKSTATDMRQLVFQLNDVFVGLTTGQRPMMVMLQQGPQVAQAFGGWGASLRALASPLGIAIAGMTALAAGAAIVIARAVSLESASRQIGVSLRAAGGAAGLSTSSIQSIIDQQYRQPGFSRADTTAAARQVLGNRNIRGADVADTLDLARNLALINGQELPQALDALLPKLTSGAAGLRQLDEAYGILTAEQLRYIDTLDRQGRQQDITRIGLDAMNARFRGEGVKSMSEFARSADDAGKAIGAALDWLVKNEPAIKGILSGFATASRMAREALVPSSAPATINDQIAAAELARRSKLSDFYAALDDVREGGRSTAYDQKRIASLSADLDALDKSIAKLKDDQFSKEIDQIIAAAIRMGVALEDARKKDLAFVDSIDAMGVAARKAADEWARLLGLLQTTADPSEIQRITDALDRQGVRQQRDWTENDPQMVADRERQDAERIQRAGRTERAIIEARIRAEREADAAIQDRRLDPAAREQYILDRIKPIIEQQGAAVRDLMEDIDAAAKHALDIAKAYGKGLKEGYLADAKAAIDEMVRTTPGLAGQEAALLRQRLQQAAAQSVSQLGQQNGTLRPQVENAERLADAEAKGAAAIREATIANQVYLATYEARARAELANNPAITAEYEKQKAILEQLIRRQSDAQRVTEAIALNRQFNPAAQFAADIARLNDLAATGRVSAEAYRRAWEEAYIRAGTASDSWLQGATAGLLEYGRQAQQVGAAVASALVTAFAAADDAIARLLLRRSVDMRQFLADISLDLTRAFVRSSITGPIASALGSLFSGGPSSSGGGVSSVGGWSGVTGSTGNGGSGGVFGSLFNGNGGGFGGIGRFFSTPIASLFGGGTIDPLTGAFGSSGLLGGTTIGQGLGFLGGVGSGIFQLASGNPIGGIGSLIGAGVSLIPGIGQIAGPVISIFSSILGGLFKSKPDIKAQGWHDFDPATGRYAGRKVFESGGATAPIAPSIGNDALKLLSAFGGSVAPGALPPSYYIWSGFEDGRMDATVTAEGSPTYKRFLNEALTNGSAKNIDEAQWIARTRLWSDSGMVDLPINALTKDSDKLMQQLALLILKAGVRDNAFTGLSGTSQGIIRNFPDADTQGLGQALQWGKETYDILVRTDTITTAEKTITGLKDSFQAAILKAKEYALATDGLVAAQDKAIKKVATDFNQGIADRILGITDPAALQRVQLDREFDALRKEAEYLNSDAISSLTGVLVDINELERAYGLERERIVSQQLDGLIALQKRLLYGDLSGASPAATAAGTQASYDAVLAQARAGSAQALANLSGVGADYVSAAQAAYGNTVQFASARDRVLADLASFIGAGGVGSTSAANGNLSTEAGQTIAMLQALVQTQSAQIAALLESQARLTEALDRAA